MTETIADIAERIAGATEEFLANATIHQRMVAILGELPAIGKDAENKQQKFMYRSHDDVMNALNPLLAKYGVFAVPEVIARLTNERTTSKGTTMYEVNLHVSYRFYGALGDYVEASAWGEGTDMGDKSTNKAMTMAFKNVLAQAFAVSTAESYDTDEHTPEETTRGRRPAPEPQREFDPGVDLLPDAPRGEGFKARIAEQLAWIGPDVDWAATINQLPGDRDATFYLRLSNATTWLHNATEGKDFPPLDDAKLMEGFAWAFNGELIEIKRKPAEPEEAILTPEEAAAMQAAMDSDDIPFPGGDEPPSTSSG